MITLRRCQKCKAVHPEYEKMDNDQIMDSITIEMAFKMIFKDKEDETVKRTGAIIQKMASLLERELVGVTYGDAAIIIEGFHDYMKNRFCDMVRDCENSEKETLGHATPYRGRVQ